MFKRHLKTFKEGIKQRKLFLEHQQTVAPNPRAHQIGRGLFGCPYINFELFKLHQILTIYYFYKFCYSFEKKIPKNHQKIYKTPQHIDLCFDYRVFVLLQRRTRYFHSTDFKRRENGFQVYRSLSK